MSLPLNESRIFFYCPDVDKPIGGTKILYRQVDVLRRGGFPAFGLHVTPGYRYSWFENQTALAYVRDIQWTPNDILVMPEIFALELCKQFPLPQKVIFNQNCYLTFAAYVEIAKDRSYIPYLDSTQVLATITVSEDSANYLRYAFPSQRIFQISSSIDTKVFYPSYEKEKLIAYMPRKNGEDAFQVLNILKFRGLLEGYEVKPIMRKTEGEVADILRRANIFLSFGYPEGFALPPLEAMSCGAMVVGYHGMGGREYFKDEFCYPIEINDIVGFTKAAEKVIVTWNNNPGPILTKARLAAQYVAENYTSEREERETLGAWSEICPK